MAIAYFEYGYLGIKRLQKGPSVEGNQLRNIEVICSLFANYSFLSLGHPVWLKHTLNMVTYIFG